MDLPGPSEIQIDEVTGAMLQDLKELAHQVNEIRPLIPEILQQVHEDLLGERVYSSNAIEGSTLTIRETRLILQTKTYLDVRKKREAQEALNLGEAVTTIEQLLESDGAWHDVSTVLDIHEILMKIVNDPIAGMLRHRNVMIAGAKRQPPGFHEVSGRSSSHPRSTKRIQRVAFFGGVPGPLRGRASCPESFFPISRGLLNPKLKTRRIHPPYPPLKKGGQGG